jgi:hypothetical protein
MVPFHELALCFRIVVIKAYSITCGNERYESIALILVELESFGTDGFSVFFVLLFDHLWDPPCTYLVVSKIMNGAYDHRLSISN